MPSDGQAYVFDAVRTPRGRGRETGALHGVKPISLVTGLIDAVRERSPGLDPDRLDDLILGIVTPIGEQGGDLPRAAALLAGLPDTVGGVQVNRFCASGLEAVNQAAARVRAGWDSLLLAGGVESMSRVPMGSDGGAWAMDPETALATSFVPQGISADLIATLEGFGRDDVDGYALRSQERAAEAQAGGCFARSVIPVHDRNGLEILAVDEHPRPETDRAALARLTASFTGLATRDEMLAGAREWILAHPDAAQPWDRPGYRLTGGGARLPGFAATLRRQLKGQRLPAPEAILAAAVEGSLVDLETAFTIETRYLISLLTGPIAKNMIGAFFFDLRAVNGGAGRPAGIESAPVRRVAVLGAGMMGAGIAYACAKSGLDVVLKDVSVEAAERGEENLPGRQPAAVLDRITPTADAAGLAGCDAVIEAVFEDPALKQAVFAEVSPVVEPGALLATNTSTLPITGLAAGVDRPADFLGMHFFSPVDRMPLIEIVVGEQTGEPALARAFDLARRIGKTPIVVNDGRGFFTSRVIGRFLDEAIGMLAEGVPAPMIEQAALQAGYPTGPLALADEVSLSLMQRIRLQYPVLTALPAHGIVDELLGRDRAGRAAGAGFYDYRDGRRARLWPGPAGWATAAGRALPMADLQERMLFAEALDALRCLDEGVLRSAAEARCSASAFRPGPAA